MAFLTGHFYLDALGIFIAIAAATVAYFKWRFTHWARRGVYSQPPSIPLGNAANLLLQKIPVGVEFKNFYLDIKSKGKPFGGYYFIGRPIFVPVDLDLVKTIMTKDFNHFTNHVNHVNEEVDPLSGHLFSMKGRKWKNLRTKLTPTFTSGKMKMMFQTLVDCSKDLVVVVDDAIKNYEAIDLKDVSGRFTTDVIGSCGFGVECNSLKDPNSEFRRNGKKIFQLSFFEAVTRLLTFTYPEIPIYLKLRTFSKELHTFFSSVVEQTVRFREQNNVIRKDFMHLLIQLKNNVTISENDLGDLRNKGEANGSVGKTDTSLNLSELTAQAFVFFVAGFETSSTTVSFCLYELARQPKLQEKLRREIDVVLEKHNGKMAYEAMMEMTYMDQCINETLRKYPPVPVHTRECTQTYRVPNSDVVLEKGSFVFIPAMGIQYDPENYPEPETFDPERFSEENKASRHSATWTPFGDGPRTCIGLRFGVMQTKVALATLLKHFKFTLCSKTEDPLTMDAGKMILTASNGVWLDAEKIN